MPTIADPLIAVLQRPAPRWRRSPTRAVRPRVPAPRRRDSTGTSSASRGRNSTKSGKPDCPAGPGNEAGSLHLRRQGGDGERSRCMPADHSGGSQATTSAATAAAAAPLIPLFVSSPAGGRPVLPASLESDSVTGQLDRPNRRPLSSLEAGREKALTPAAAHALPAPPWTCAALTPAHLLSHAANPAGRSRATKRDLCDARAGTVGAGKSSERANNRRGRERRVGGEEQAGGGKSGAGGSRRPALVVRLNLALFGLGLGRCERVGVLGQVRWLGSPAQEAQ